LIHIPDGDFDLHYLAIKTQLNLKYLGFDQGPLDLNIKKRSAQAFCERYKLPSDWVNTDDLKNRKKRAKSLNPTGLISTPPRYHLQVAKSKNQVLSVTQEIPTRTNIKNAESVQFPKQEILNSNNAPYPNVPLWDSSTLTHAKVVQFHVTVDSIVKEMQFLLRSFGFLPSMANLDGIFNSIISTGLKSFQEFYNQVIEEKDGDIPKQYLFGDTPVTPLKEDGILSHECLSALRLAFSSVISKLTNLYKIPDVPLLEPDEFVKSVKSFQLHTSLVPDGVLSKKTIAKITQLLKDNIDNITM